MLEVSKESATNVASTVIKHETARVERMETTKDSMANVITVANKDTRNKIATRGRRMKPREKMIKQI